MKRSLPALIDVRTAAEETGLPLDLVESMFKHVPHFPHPGEGIMVRRIDLARYLGLTDYVDDDDEPGPDDALVESTQVVYFAVIGPIVKIGISAGPQARVSKYQGAVMVATEPGGRAREHDLHIMFKHARSTLEWFHLSRLVRRYIEALPTFTGWPDHA